MRGWSLKGIPHDTYPPFDGEGYLMMGRYDEAWKEYRVAFANHEASENEKEAAFIAKQKAKFSEWEERARIYREKIPGIHRHQAERISAYIERRNRVLSDVEHRLNTLGCYILFRIRAQFEDEDHALGGPLSASPSQPPYKPPSRAPATPPQPSSSHNREKIFVEAPQIAVLDTAAVSDSDDEPLSAPRDVKEKGKGKTIVVPRAASKKKAAKRASSERAASDRAESEEEGESDGSEPDPITRSVKVKKGRRTVSIDLTGPRNSLGPTRMECCDPANDLAPIQQYTKTLAENSRPDR
ncbi:hypothetical protein B0H13DRAFT_1901574 [Mycena leptocephala]|nr:hypothetical protein B0H13DRAFT_1901574 [Mycena leptocephala]